MANNENANDTDNDTGEEKTTDEEYTDIFYMQQQMTETLMDLLGQQDRDEVPVPTETIYVQPPSPVYKSPNYLLYIAAGVGLLIYFGKIKL